MFRLLGMYFGGAAFLLAALAKVLVAAQDGAAIELTRLAAAGKVEERFQAYNIEMLEVTGGRFWKPYADLEKSGAGDSGPTPTGMNPNLYQYRPPVDLANARLRKLAAALGPAYVRVSGTWANTTYFHNEEGPAPKNPPDGFRGVLTRAQWKGVVDFARAANAEIITSFATGNGTRGKDGVWTSDQAKTLVKYTKAAGGNIAAVEFMNEPNFAAMGGAPKGYDAAAYARDMAVVKQFLKETAPEVKLLGPGSAVEGGALSAGLRDPKVTTEALMRATGPVYDVFSYHIYSAASRRCAGNNTTIGTTPEAALTAEWLGRSDKVNAYYVSMRDRYEPGKPLWVTETADAACGGNPWSSTFLDTFRYLDEHASLARQGVRVVAHNTLAASDYGLLEETDFTPRPNYWAALLWHKLMGITVLKTEFPEGSAVRLYAHCTAGVPGSVTLMALNTSRSEAASVEMAMASERYTMTAPKLDGKRVELNGRELALGTGDELPQLMGLKTAAGRVALPPASVSFLVAADAGNSSCQ